MLTPAKMIDPPTLSVKTHWRPIWHITKVFTISKAVLFLLLYIQTTVYDTSSSSLLFPEVSASSSFAWHIVQRLARRLCIWDTVFHATAGLHSDKDLRYEHEWAFGIGWSQVVGVAGKALIRMFGNHTEVDEKLYFYVLGASLVSTVGHYVACLVLYAVTIQVYSSSKSPHLVDLLQQAQETAGAGVVEATTEQKEAKAREQRKTNLNAGRVARKAATLYALSPAGMFMLAGYSEPVFAALSFAAMEMRRRKLYIAAGSLFGFAALLRSNGLLWGIVFLGDLATVLNGLVRSWNSPSKQSVRRELLIAGAKIIAGGLIIGGAFCLTQFKAYKTYCTNASTTQPEWCEARVPLIYSYIQSKYWGVGFLRYWTPNNIPNFLFAFPTLAVMWKSGCYYSYYLPKSIKENTSTPDISEHERAILRKIEYFSPYLAVQLVMFFACLLSWHVQIITRIGSCLPVIYWYTAEMLTSTQLSQVKTGKIIARYFMVWIVVQGIFFSAFMPPA